MINMILTVLILNVILSLVISSFVENREISKLKVFLLSFLFSPIIGMFAALMSQKKEVSTKAEDDEFIGLPRNYDNNFIDKIQKFLPIIFILLIFAFVIKILLS